MALRARPLTIAQANAHIVAHHRHHKPVVGHRFSIGAVDEATGTLVGIAVVGRPVARGCDPYAVAEVTRLATDGTRNACSFLYARAARAAEAMGFDKIQTYILDSEDGTSLKAAGWRMEGDVYGRAWKRADGDPRRTDQPNTAKTRWARVFTPVVNPPAPEGTR